MNSWKDYNKNSFSIFLVNLIGDKNTVDLIKKYKWGVDGNYTVFWQIDYEGKVRSGKMIKYKSDGHRDKKSFTTWYHKKTIFTDFNMSQCFFGEHLLKEYPVKPVAIVESEKTAILASFFIGRYVWLACGGKSQIGYSKCAILKNRNVTLFPDLGAYTDWKEKAHTFGFNISNHLEKIATPEQKEKGLDIADFLIQHHERNSTTNKNIPAFLE